MIRIKSDKISWRYILILLRFTKTRLNMYCNKQIMRIYHSHLRLTPHNGWIQTLFLRILKNLNIEISTRPSESTSKMSQKLEKMRSRGFRDVWNFSIQSFETLTRFCGNTAFKIWNLTGPSERGPRDLWGSVLWRYTNLAIMWIFMILLKLVKSAFIKNQEP